MTYSALNFYRRIRNDVSTAVTVPTARAYAPLVEKLTYTEHHIESVGFAFALCELQMFNVSLRAAAGRGQLSAKIYDKARRYGDSLNQAHNFYRDYILTNPTLEVSNYPGDWKMAASTSDMIDLADQLYVLVDDLRAILIDIDVERLRARAADRLAADQLLAEKRLQEARKEEGMNYFPNSKIRTETHVNHLGVKRTFYRQFVRYDEIPGTTYLFLGATLIDVTRKVNRYSTLLRGKARTEKQLTSFASFQQGGDMVLVLEIDKDIRTETVVFDEGWFDVN